MDFLNRLENLITQQCQVVELVSFEQLKINILGAGCDVRASFLLKILYVIQINPTAVISADFFFCDIWCSRDLVEPNPSITRKIGNPDIKPE